MKEDPACAGCTVVLRYMSAVLVLVVETRGTVDRGTVKGDE